MHAVTIFQGLKYHIRLFKLFSDMENTGGVYDRIIRKGTFNPS